MKDPTFTKQAEALHSNDEEQIIAALKDLINVIPGKPVTKPGPNNQPIEVIDDRRRQFLSDFLNSIPFALLFGCFNTASDVQIELSETVVSKLLDCGGTEQAKEIIKNPEFQQYLLLGSQHPNPVVRKLAVSQFKRFTQKEQDFAFILHNPQVLQILLTALQDDNLGVAREAITCFINIAKNEAGLSMIFSDDCKTANTNKSIIETLREISAKNTVLQLRVFEFIAELSTLSESAFRYCQRTGFFDQIRDGLKSSDNTLYKLNIMEVIKKMCESPLGIEYFQQTETFPIIFSYLEGAESDPILSSFVMDFIGELVDKAAHTKKHEILFSGGHTMPIFEKMFQNLTYEYDAKVREVAITTIGSFCANSNNFLNHVLLSDEYVNQGPKYTRVFLEFGIRPPSSSVDSTLRTAFLHALGTILESSHCDTKSLERLYRLYYSQCTEFYAHHPSSNGGGGGGGGRVVTPVALWMNLLRKSLFGEHRYAVFHAMKGLAHHEWGIKELVEYPGFVDWITDRETETTKEGKEWKFVIVQRILASRNAIRILNSQHYVKLSTFVKFGPFYKPTASAVVVATRDSANM